MELKKGYKQTEIGVIPEDWEVKELGELLKIKNGKNQRLIEDNSGKYPILGTGGIIGYTNIPIYEKCSVLIGRKGSINKPYYYETPFWTVDTLYYSEIFDGVYAKFIYYKFTNINWYLYNEASGVPSLNKNTIESIKISIPKTIEEQTAIANALTDIDDLINALETKIEKKKNIKQGAMQELLKPKEGWVEKRLGEIGKISGAGVDKLINKDETPIRLVNYMDVLKRDFIKSNELHHWVTAPIEKIEKCSVKKGDIFFTPSSEMRYDIALSAVAIEDIPNAVYSYHLVRLRLFDDWDLNFRTYIFNTRYFLEQAEQMCEGSGKRYVLSLPIFRNLKIYYTEDVQEQNEIATILSDMDKEIEGLKGELEKYRMMKDGMMKDLLTGRIRLI